MNKIRTQAIQTTSQKAEVECNVKLKRKSKFLITKLSCEVLRWFR